ncbi:MULTISPECIES: restriction endonuclease subunit S [Streptomyces griseus group]|uniref:restriction endonuclease subunit S n=1 Tax=Streptomyces griseus group TaxID=629295 RepID=UPI0030819CF4
MTAEHKRHAAYKASGSPWIGDIPEHWTASKLRYLTRARKERDRPELPLLSVVRDRGVINRMTSTDISNHNRIPDDLSNYKVARAGDLVVNKMKAWQGSLGISPIDGIVSPAYFVFDTTFSNRDFANTLFRSAPYISHFGSLSDGVRVGQWDLSLSGLREIPVFMPPADEQLAIVKYLRYIEREVGAAVRAKRRLASLLNEQKLAIVNHLITRGTRGPTASKQSAILGLSDIPEHWDSMRLKRATSHIVDCLHATPKYVASGGYPVIRTADIEPGRTLHENAYRISPKEYSRWTSRLEPRADDILYSREGGRFGIAAPVPPEVRLCIGQRMVAIRINEAHSSEYMMWQLNCRHVFDQASADMVGSASPRVNVEQIKNYRITAPPLKEQQEIVERINLSCAKIDSVIRRTEREIALLREYHTRLTADVVTGKLDVRAAAAALPDVDPHDPDLVAVYDTDEDGTNADLDRDGVTEESM